jgi:hypothetical protein
VLDKYQVQYVLFPPGESSNSLLVGGKLTEVLERDPRWKTVYSDKVCVLLERRAP